MNKRPLDKTKKSNIKCVNCENWYKPKNNLEPFCVLTLDNKNYWNRCKQFEWRDDIKEGRQCGVKIVNIGKNVNQK